MPSNNQSNSNARRKSLFRNGRPVFARSRGSRQTGLNYGALEDRLALTTFIVTTASDNNSGVEDGFVSLREAVMAANTNSAFGDAPAGEVDGDIIRFDPSIYNSNMSLTLGQIGISDDVLIQGGASNITISGNGNTRLFEVAATERVAFGKLTFDNGSAAIGGAMNIIGSGTTLLFETTFTNNVATGVGGGAVYYANGNMFVTDSTFNGNLANGATGSGGAIYQVSGNIYVTDGLMDSNTANRSGGAVEAVGGTFFAVGLTVGTTAIGASDSTAIADQPKKVLLYMLDGLAANGTYGFDSLLANGDIPAFQSLIEGTWDPAYNGAYDPASQSGGFAGTNTEQLTLTHVSFTTIYTGVYANLHGVTADFASTPANFQDYRPFTRILREELGTSIRLTTHARGFHTVNIHENDLAVFDVVGLDGANGTVPPPHASLNATLLDQSGALNDELILYYDNDIDIAGHVSSPGGGTGDPNYGAAIESIDNDLAGSLAAILSRPNFMDEDWTILVASDHGVREAPGGGHGQQSVAEKETPLILAGKFTSQRELPGTTIASIAPTILNEFGVTRPSYYVSDPIRAGNVAGPVGSANPGNGGGLHVAGTARVTLQGGEYVGNFAAKSGGGLWVGEDGLLFVRPGTMVTNNRAAGALIGDGGGGIYNSSAELYINQATISSNSASGAAGSGGGIYSDTGKTILNIATVDSNAARRTGGGIHIDSELLALTNSAVTNNDVGTTFATTVGHGGGIYAEGSATVVVDDGQVANNKATLRGGGIWADTASVVFLRNTASVSFNTLSDSGSLGGGMYTTGYLQSIDAFFQRNVATTAGGGLYLSGSINARIDNTNFFENNGGNRGGGIFNDSSMYITNSPFTKNTVSVNGGGYFTTPTASTLAMGLSFTGNLPNNTN